MPTKRRKSSKRQQSHRSPKRKLGLKQTEESPSAAAELRRLFVDPGSISSGWAYYVGKDLRAHGTVRTDKSWSIFSRLHCIWAEYRQLLLTDRIDEVHLEQLPRMCHIFTHWSVGVIGHALYKFCPKIEGDVPVKSWQKFCGWDGKQGDKFAKEGPEPIQEPKSEDERAAIGMGYYYVNKA